MNLTELIQLYPKSAYLLQEFVKEQFKDKFAHIKEMEDNYLSAPEEFRKSNPYPLISYESTVNYMCDVLLEHWDRILYDFFDENLLPVVVDYFESEGKRLWDFTIAQEYEFSKFNNRKEAEKEAFKEAFKILNG